MYTQWLYELIEFTVLCRSPHSHQKPETYEAVLKETCSMQAVIILGK